MSVTRQARTAGRRAANSKALELTARAGFVARGAIYVLIGLIAVQIAVGRGGQADRGGALAQIAAQSYGAVVLWLLVLGFAGLALWRFSEATFGATGPGGHETGERVSNSQSQTLTARVMAYSGGRILVGLVGVAVVITGVLLARTGWTKQFLKEMNLAGAPAGTRSLVSRLGTIGGVARGAVVALAGVFLAIAAVRFSPSDAEGIDGTLRAFAQTPLGPLLLAPVGLGLASFGLFSWCEARWRRV